jgi:ribosome biogenesis GTPase A
VLVGNPNVGKSVVFNYLSGMYVDVSNFPGTTVEISRATYLAYDLLDTPGITAFRRSTTRRPWPATSFSTATSSSTSSTRCTLSGTSS